MPFLRQIQHLLPRAEAWRVETQKRLRQLFEGLVAGAFEPARQYIDDATDDLWPDTTRELGEWERQHGIAWPAASTEQRIAALKAEWVTTGGQSLEYIQGVLQAAGFDVYCHPWWVPDVLPYEPRNPHDWLDDVQLGTVQCGEPLAQCGEPGALANTTTINVPSYIANLDLTSRAPPPLPTDPLRWRGFMYVGGETFGDVATINSARQREFEHLLLKLRPQNVWVGLFVEGVPGFDEPILDDNDDSILTDGDEPIYA